MDDTKNFFDKYIYIEDEINEIITTYDKKIASIGFEVEKITLNGATKKINSSAIKENEVLNALNEDDRERITNMFVLAVNISSLTGSILEIYVFKEERYAVVDISNDFLDLFSDAIVVLGSLLIQASEVAVHTYSDADFENYATLSLYFDFENDSSNVINTFKKMLKNTKNES